MDEIARLFAPFFSGIPTSLPVFIEYIAVVVGALSGALFACDKKLDIIGVTTLACAAGLGGGLLRDVLLQSYGIYAFQYPTVIVCCIAAGLVVFYFRGIFKNLSSMIFLFDAVSMGLFAYLGADKAMQAGLSFVPVVLLGTMTAVGGGALRDILASEVPQIFKQGNFYGIAGLCGTFLFALLASVNVIRPLSGLVCIIVAVALRYFSVIFDWRTSEPQDLTTVFVGSVQQFFKQVFLRSGNEDEHETSAEAVRKTTEESPEDKERKEE